jgi:NAD(P)-dependent dehydrogenase (short-subunit alcohol dehydrogenase family)
MLIKGKVIVITGGAGLIGQEFAKAIIDQGGMVIIADIDEERMQCVSKELSQELKSDSVDFFKLDITSKNSISECIEYVNGKYKRIDALINNAYPRNKNYGRHFFDVEYDDFVENLGMNLGGCIIPSQLFSLYFQKQGYGNIVNISSIYGVIAPKFEIYNNTEMTMPVEYAAIKSGMLHLTKYMAKYLKGTNIRVNAISPGGILDGQPNEFLRKYNQKCSTKGMLDGKDLNGTLIFLLSDMSSYVNGQNLVVDDGFIL